MLIVELTSEVKLNYIKRRVARRLLHCSCR